MAETFFKHPTALVESDQVGEGTNVWAYAHVMKGAAVGRHCNIGDHAFIESGASRRRRGDDQERRGGVAVRHDREPRVPRPELLAHQRQPAPQQARLDAGGHDHPRGRHDWRQRHDRLRLPHRAVRLRRRRRRRHQAGAGPRGGGRQPGPRARIRLRMLPAAHGERHGAGVREVRAALREVPPGRQPSHRTAEAGAEGAKRLAEAEAKAEAPKPEAKADR